MIELRREPIQELCRPAVLTSDPGFDRLARLVARVLQAPTALIALAGGDRRELKGAFGLDDDQREPSPPSGSEKFIDYIVRSGRPLVVRDARRQLALGGGREPSESPPIACLGVPLTAAGCRVVGAFCVIDRRIRAWTDADLQTLQELAEAATWELRSQAEKAELVRAQRRSALQHAAASILAEASTIDGALASILRVVGERLDFEAGESWMCDGSEAGLRRSSRDWFSREAGRLYLNRSRELNQAPRWAMNASAGIVDLEVDEWGLDTAAVAPLTHDGRRFGMLTFVGRKQSTADESLGLTLSDLGREIGRFINRRGRDDDLRDFAAVIDQSSDMIILATPRGRVRHLNAAGRALAGYRDGAVPEDLRIGDLLPQYDLLAGASEPFSDRRWSGQTILKRPRTGREIAVDASLFLVRDPHNARPLGMAAIVRDARARTRDEALLLEGKARLRGILEASLDALVTLDHEGDVIEFNPAAERIFGLNVDATIGRRFAERPAFHPAMHQRIEHAQRLVVGDMLLRLGRHQVGKVEIRRAVHGGTPAWSCRQQNAV